MSPKPILDRFRQPEYVGENRCLPCTVVNLVIALVAAVAIGGGATAVGGPPLIALSAGGVVLVGSVVAVYLRGYLVPGTPTMTKRYLPVWLLRLFGKAPEPDRDDAGNVDVEAVLIDAGVLEECADRNDLCLTDSFETAWHARIDAIETEDPGLERLLKRGELEASVGRADVTFEERGDAYVASAEGRRIAQWASREAYLADVAAAAVLGEWYAGWHAMGFHERTEVAGSLRLWLDRCPECGGPVEMGQETVSSCCHERQVLASSCDACGSRLFEANVSPEAVEAA